MKRRIYFVIYLLFLALWVGLPMGGQKTFAGVSSDPVILAAFDELREYIVDLPGGTLNKGQCTSLTRKLENAKKAYQHGLPCTGVNILGAYLNETQALRRGERLQVAEILYNWGRKLRGQVLETLPEDKTCPGHQRFGMTPVVEVKESDNKHLLASMSFGEPGLVSVEVEDELYTQVILAGVESRAGEPGLPGIPVVSRLVAVPRGAEVSVHIQPPSVAETILLNLYPFQPRYPDIEEEPDPFPDINYDPPFVKDEEVYASEGPFPPTPCTVTPLGRFRDLPIALVSCAAGKYDPKKNRLVLYKSVDFELRFSGGSGAFVTKASQNPFESQIADYSKVVLNRDDVFDHVEDRYPEPTCPGEELIIITHKDFRSAADKLAKWKNDKGILTNVFDVDSSTTAKQIDDFIDQRYAQCIVRPSYVLLFGDAEYIPTFYLSTVFSSKSASDFHYSNYPSGSLDLLPDFGVGRIPVDTLQQAYDVVNKIIKYEGNPPLKSYFYKNMSLSAMFECCRFDVPKILPMGVITNKGWDRKAYIETCELFRDKLTTRGYNVERIYTKETCDLYLNLLGDDTPRYYYDGTLLPQDLGPTSGFAWGGSTQNIVNAFNSGRFLILHRDHASENGWAWPKFKKDHFSQLSNGDLLPVVFSVNCSSGFFDNETNPGEQPQLYRKGQLYPSPNPPWSTGPETKDKTYFAEELLRKANGGAIGFIGATRDTPDTGDDALTRGLFDALWPDIVSSHGGTTSLRRLGDILNYAKLYVLFQVGAPQTLGTVSLLDWFAVLPLFHVLGDPTLEMWTSKPVSLSPHFKLDAFPDSLLIKYDIDGATITALQETEEGLAPIGRATVKDGNAILKYVVLPQPDVPILLSASLENAVSRSLTSPQPVDLSDESSFDSLATRISFDPAEGRTLFEHISNQYEAFGVLFVDDETTTPLVVDEATRQGTTHSEPYSLVNDADTIDPGSAGVPLTMTFTNPVQRVGMYIGNGGWGADGATLTAYDQYGGYIFSVERTGFGNNVDTFIGLDVGAPSISQMQLNYGNTSASEEIDDLIFE